MCDAIGIVKGFQAIAGFAAEQAAANAQDEANARTRLQIKQAGDDKIRQQVLKERTETNNLLQQKIDNDITALEQTQRALLSAGEANVAGRVVNAVGNKFERDRLTTNNTIETDLQMLALQGTFDRKGIDAEVQSQLNQYQPVDGPSPLLLAGDLGMSAVEADRRKKEIT